MRQQGIGTKVDKLEWRQIHTATNIKFMNKIEPQNNTGRTFLINYAGSNKYTFGTKMRLSPISYYIQEMNYKQSILQKITFDYSPMALKQAMVQVQKVTANEEG